MEKQQELSQEKAYNEKLMQGKNVARASEEVGRQRVSKAIDILNRIEIETRYKEENNGEGER